MSSEEKSTKPIPEQIVEAMIADISSKKEFDEQLIKRIEGLYGSGNLKRAERIIEVITPNSEA